MFSFPPLTPVVKRLIITLFGAFVLELLLENFAGIPVIKTLAFDPVDLGPLSLLQLVSYVLIQNPREVMGKLAKASAEDVAKVFGKDIDAVYARMKKDGLQAGDKGKSVQELAADNDKPAEGILIYFVK